VLRVEVCDGARTCVEVRRLTSSRVSRRMACVSLHICKISLFSLLDFV